MSAILITCGTGFIGSYVAAELDEFGHKIVILDKSDDISLLKEIGDPTNYEIIQGNITSSKHVNQTVQRHNITQIIHLAGLPVTPNQQKPRNGVEVNIIGTTNVFEAAKNQHEQVERVVWASTAMVYGEYQEPDSTAFTEDHPTSPINLYSATKDFCEHLGNTYSKHHNLSQIGLRITVVYGLNHNPSGEGFLTPLMENPPLGKPVEIGYGGPID